MKTKLEIGFIPIEWIDNENGSGRVYTKVELLEVSICKEK